MPLPEKKYTREITTRMVNDVIKIIEPIMARNPSGDVGTKTKEDQRLCIVSAQVVSCVLDHIRPLVKK